MPLPNPGMTFTPFDPLPASDLNDLVENIEALADGTGFDSGLVVQEVGTSYNAVTTGLTTVIPFDTSIPQITEGDEVMTQVITPKSATNILVIRAIVFAANNGAVRSIASALFKNSDANALATTVGGVSTADQPMTIPLEHRIVAGGTSAITFRIRIGANTSGTTTFNGASGANRFGTATKSSIIITELAA